MRFTKIMLALLISGSTNVALADEPVKQKASSFTTSDRTNIDFSETLVDGKMQAPQGFFLQGRQAQSMTQMVRLRSKFRSELRNSRSAVKAIVK
jgi:hypothetical protein